MCKTPNPFPAFMTMLYTSPYRLYVLNQAVDHTEITLPVRQPTCTFV